ncbi:MAG: septal ring lytic transglycosylase RlpA family protein [Ignavibacteria bacterium]|nr:septal ring lytic transglycosylase RlpA family protein [Ignavibacteria bacterium]
MSVSFLVEAHDVPEGVKAIASISDSVAPESEFSVFELRDVSNGLASWYGKGFQGRRTASGRRYNMHELTAAHRTLPFGTLLRVVNSRTGDAIIVEITDRGPFIKRRVVDLSYASAKRIGVSVTPVELDAITPDDIQEFYNNNDTTLLVIAQTMQVQVWPVNSVLMVSDFVSYSEAASDLAAGEVVVAQRGTDSKAVYARGRIINAELAAVEI